MASDNKPATPVKVIANDIQIELDTKIGRDDIVNLRLVEVEDSLSQQRAAEEHNLAAAQKEYEKATARLTKLAEDLVEEQEAKDQDTKNLLEAIEKKTGKKYAAIFVSNDFGNYSTYHKPQNPDDVEAEVDIAAAKIKGEMRVVEYRSTKGRKATVYAGVDAVVEWKHEVDFTPGMQDAVKAISAAADTVNQIKDKLVKVKQQIADLPRLRRRTEAALTKAIISGEITDGKTLIEAVTNPNLKALPLI